MSMKFSYEHFIESENAIVAIKRVRTFHSRAQEFASPGFHDTVLNRILMVFTWWFAGTLAAFRTSPSRKFAGPVPNERTNRLDRRRYSESVRIRIEVGYVAGNVGSLIHYLWRMSARSALIHPHGNSQFLQSKGFQSPFNFSSKVTKASLQS